MSTIITAQSPAAATPAALLPASRANYDKAAADDSTAGGARARTLARYLLTAGLSVLLALALKAWVAAPFRVTSGSMKNTLQTGEVLLVNRWPATWAAIAGGAPRIDRGDVVVFRFPGAPAGAPAPPVLPGEHFIKRVVGLPGDRVEVRGAFVYVNGILVDEARVHADETPGDDQALRPLDGPGAEPGAGDPYRVYYEAGVSFDEFAAPDPAADEGVLFGRRGAPVTVPADSYFVMGDNRSHSYDSRYWGFVPAALVEGRAAAVAYSPSASRIGAAVR